MRFGQFCVRIAIRDFWLWRRRREQRLSVAVVGYWFPAYGHPDGRSQVAWFRVVDDLGYRTEEHPAGASEFPCFKLIDGWAHPTLNRAETTLPTLQVVGSFAYKEQGGPWFRIERRAQ